MTNLEKYRSLLHDGVQGLLLTSRYSRMYAAEFDIAEGVAVVSAQGARYFTDSRYIESAQKNLKGFEVVEIGLNNPIEGRHVIIVEDIVDTGESIEHMIGELKSHNPASIEVCTLFFKPDSYRKQLPIKYRAMEIGNEFIVGYGLDYDQLGRSLKDIYVVTE